MAKGGAFQPRPVVLPQPLEERVDKAAERQLAGTGLASRTQGRNAATGENDPKGWWYHDGEGNWEFRGLTAPGVTGRLSP